MWMCRCRHGHEMIDEEPMLDSREARSSVLRLAMGVHYAFGRLIKGRSIITTMIEHTYTSTYV